MAKPTSQFVCQECGAVYPKWAGRCDSCGGWNCIEEVAITSPTTSKSVAGRTGQ
ncbi:MAG: DNA repair protein RadA, partial [Alphaproteobacteria bacterium]